MNNDNGKDWNDIHREQGTEGARASIDEAMARAEQRRKFEEQRDKDFPEIGDDEPPFDDPKPEPPTLVQKVKFLLKKNPGGPFDDDAIETFARLRREDRKAFLRLCKLYPALAEVFDLQYDDFVAYMVQHNYMFIPTRQLWPVISETARAAT